jgi:hypothetical protein
MKHLTLSTWAALTEENPPTLPTLRKWAANGQISPAPEKHGKRWMVQANAVYVPKLREYEKPDGGMSDRCRAIIGR